MLFLLDGTLSAAEKTPIYSCGQYGMREKYMDQEKDEFAKGSVREDNNISDIPENENTG